MVLTPAAVDLLGPYLARQRWYAGTAEPDSGSLRLLESECLDEASGGRRLQWAILSVDGVRYQLLLGDEPATGGPAPRGEGVGLSAVSAGRVASEGQVASAGGGGIPESALVGVVGDRRLYDAVVDPELMLLLFERLAGSPAAEVRLVGTEQSNTSLVYDERVILKLYRRLAEGVNPDIEVTSALASAGFDHVAAPVATWRSDDVDLAFAQRFLAGGSEGWGLAVSSARQLICGAVEDPAGAPWDFAAESEDLGRVTAGMHLALARAFGVDQDSLGAGWSAFVDDLEDRTAAEAATSGGPGHGALQRVFHRLRRVVDPGPAIRLHGDFHLGQVMRAGGRWYALDFEGEPTRALEERTRRSSVAKDVSGMLRSIDYAARYALLEAEAASQPLPELAAQRCAAWERRNRAAFLRGYLTTPDVEALIAQGDDSDAVLAAFELDKALYELRYEEAYRPDWIAIPRAAIDRLLERLSAPGDGA
jgi:maltokinase